ncbi:hypothetical protein [Xylanibacter brevis]|uniref:hypothetical protein n=1 Tax=Xylanibacter brevis TaxID=83231 RepID=UPI000AC9CF68|nr:hypothetical protein [Xylanibacter brevis]
MKKKYIAPEMAITVIETRQMLASSLLNTTSTPTQDDFTKTTTETGNNLSRRYDVWEDWEE